MLDSSTIVEEDFAHSLDATNVAQLCAPANSVFASRFSTQTHWAAVAELGPWTVRLLCRVNRPLLILDLDETLVYATEQELSSAPDFRIARYAVYRRPHLSAFLDYCFSDFDVAVWTSASRSYASEVVRQVFGDRELRFFWSAERCIQRIDFRTYDSYTVKDLRKVRRLGFALEQILMVDDSPEKLERNYGNYIRIAPFEGDVSDSELPHLVDYLRSIRNQPNYRTIEKRHWRTTTNTA